MALLQLQRATVISLLESNRWLAALAAEDVERLADGARTVEWERGEVLFEEGEHGTDAFVLHTGAVKVVRTLPDGRRVHLARVGAGSVVGELALFNAGRRSATVEALEPTVAIALAGPQVMRILKRDAEASLGVATYLADMLRASDQRLFEHALSSTTGRVAATLLGQVEARQRQGAGGRDVEVIGSAVDVARLSGAPREGVARALHWFENEGLITLKRGRTIVHDPAALGRYLS